MKLYYEKLPYDFRPHYEDNDDPLAVVNFYEPNKSAWERAYVFPVELPMFKPQIDCLAKARNVCRCFMEKNAVLDKPTDEVMGNALWWILMLHTLTVLNSAPDDKNVLVAFSDASVGFLATNNDIRTEDCLSERPEWLKSAVMAFEPQDLLDISGARGYI